MICARNRTRNRRQIQCVVALTAVFFANGAVAEDEKASNDNYGEIQVLYDYEDRDEKLGHVSFGAVGDALDKYFAKKDAWSADHGLNLMIESAPIFQEHIDGGAGSQINNETNLIAQWALVDKSNASRGNLMAWYQFSATWGGQTTSEFMDRMGVLSPPNGGDTAPSRQRDLMQHFVWEQKFSDDRVRIQIGKMTSRVLFNLNRYAVSDREDFLTPMLVNNPVAHYTARVGFGTFAEYKVSSWYVSGMIRDADADLSKRFIDFDSLSTGNWEYLGEFGYTPDNFAGLGKGVYRITASHSDSTGTATDGLPSTGSIAFSFDQDFGDRIGGYFRYAVSDDTFRAFKRRVAVGVQLKEPLGFANDRFGIGYWKGQPTDSALRDESGIDMFWKLQIAKFMEVSAGLQFIFDPALQPDRSKATVATLRLRLLL